MIERLTDLSVAGDLLYHLAQERASELRRDAERGRAYRRTIAER